MWAHFGDRTDGPPGTHFYRSGEPILYFWNMFDQLLIRPALMEALEFVRILDTDGQDTLLAASGIPDKNNVSDHLPLLFALDL